jgi:hypothetical protein
MPGPATNGEQYHQETMRRLGRKTSESKQAANSPAKTDQPGKPGQPMPRPTRRSEDSARLLAADANTRIAPVRRVLCARKEDRSLKKRVLEHVRPMVVEIGVLFSRELADAHAAVDAPGVQQLVADLRNDHEFLTA